MGERGRRRKTDASTTEGQPKQQTAPQPGLRDKHKGKNDYEDYKGLKAFLKGSSDEHAVDPNDVDQGSLGDCYFIASLAAVARANPKAIEELITDNENGTFEVTLYIRPHAWSDPVPVTKTVDSMLVSKISGVPLYAGLGDKSEGNKEAWAPLLEKRLALEKGSYNDISGGRISKKFNYSGAFELLTGKGQSTQMVSALSDDEALLLIQDCLDNNKPVTCGTLSGKQGADLTQEANKLNVYWNHAYAPVSVDAGAKTLTLQNPWGTNHVEKLSVQDFRRFYKTIRIGESI